MDAKIAILEQARDLGFDLAGITSAEPLEPAIRTHWRTWLKRGYAGDMTYLPAHEAQRMDPRLLLAQAASVVVVGLSYKLPAEAAVPAGRARVARYARYPDYHGLLKSRLHALAETVRDRFGAGVGVKVCVDTAPLAERSLAQRAGLGFIGRSHMLIHPRLGPELFLGALVLSAPLPPDSPLRGDCGTCRRCVQACPTGALRADGFFEATRCLNYLTIEHRGEIPAVFHAALATRLVGCDTCVTVCPYHQQAPPARHPALRPDPGRTHLDPAEVLTWSEADFQARLGDSPLARLGRARLQRNARICLGRRASSI